MDIETEFKLKRTTREVEGISFRYGNISFKGSEVDRTFSFENLRKEFEKNMETAKIQVEKVQEQQEKQPSKVQRQTESKPKASTIGGVELTDKQWETLKEGGFIYLENMSWKNGGSKFFSVCFYG